MTIIWQSLRRHFYLKLLLTIGLVTLVFYLFESRDRDESFEPCNDVEEDLSNSSQPNTLHYNTMRPDYCTTMYERKQAKCLKRKLQNLKQLKQPFWAQYSTRTRPLFVRAEGSWGRLGNHMYEYASVFGIAHRTNRTPLISYRLSHFLGEYFNVRIPVDSTIGVTEQLIFTDFLTFKEETPRGYMVVFESLPDDWSVTFGESYLQSQKYFKHVEDELRQELTFRDSVLTKARTFLKNSIPSNWNGSNFTRVVIHVRRTDLLSDGWRREGWLLPGRDYFMRAIDYIRQCYDRVLFFVLSDDMDWCKKNIVGDDIVYSSRLSPGEDLALASFCDHAIVTHGTFGMWCSWFAGGLTIRHLNNTVPGSNASRIDLTDFYPSYTVLI